MKPDSNSLADAVFSIVSAIPRGKVLAYGDVARLAGWPNHSRLVGKILHYDPRNASTPCHRVVYREGFLSPAFPQQRVLLAAEGVEFLPNGRVDMKKFRWDFEADV